MLIGKWIDFLAGTGGIAKSLIRLAGSAGLEPATSWFIAQCRKGEELSFKQWAELFLKNYSKPPLRSPKTYETHVRAVKHLLKAFGDHKLTDLTSDAIEGYMRY